jgi:hypothetical protein
MAFKKKAKRAIVVFVVIVWLYLALVRRTIELVLKPNISIFHLFAIKEVSRVINYHPFAKDFAAIGENQRSVIVAKTLKIFYTVIAK